MKTHSNLNPQFNTYNQQKCFIAYTHKASWSEDILAACTEVLPRFGLEAWYADDQFEPGRSLKEKVVEMIANARYGIFDLSATYDNERKEWVLPRNVLIELGIAIALNRPVLLLRTAENRVRGCPLPTCLSGIDDIIEFSGEITLKRALEERIPQWLNVSPEQMWWTRSCLFGNRVCDYREVHPRMERWQQEGLHCHIADGPDADRVDFRCLVEDEIGRYNDLTFDYLDACKPTHPYHFVQCAHCQVVRSSQFAIYRITPQTDAETYVAIGMSIALETQFGYEIPKIFFTGDVREVPSLLRGYEVVEAVNTKGRKLRLRKALPVVVQRVGECVWKPCVLPFEKTLPIVLGDPVRKESEVVEDGPMGKPVVVVREQLRHERLRRGWAQAELAEKLGTTVAAVGRWERGLTSPSAYFRIKLCEIFDKSSEELGLVDQQNSQGVEVRAFHEQLRRERLRHNWRQADLADRLGTTVGVVSRWERGSALPSPYFRIRLCDIFGKSLEELGLMDQQNGKEVEKETNGTTTTIGQETQFCDNCGAENVLTARFCQTCATPFPFKHTATAIGQEKDLAESYSGLQLEPSSRRVWIDGNPVSGSLPERQFKLLQFLAEHAGEICPREETSKAVYGESYIQFRDDERLDALIERTRLHIGDTSRHPRFIETVRNVGHRLNEYIGERS